jgi:hypothetical protein
MLSKYRIWMWVPLFFSGTCLAGSAAQKTLNELTSEKPGSPYHWVSDNAMGGKVMERVLSGTPGPTVADDTVKKDILANIGTFEEKAGGDKMPKLVEVRQLPKVRDEYNEVWVVSRAGQNVAYTVSLQSSAQGGVDFHVRGPWD